MLKKGISGLALAALLTVSVSGGQVFAAEKGNAKGGSVDLTNVITESTEITNEMVTPFTAVNVGGGQWDYGTSVVWGIPLKKKVYSNYNHPSLVHSASCSIGTTYSNSGKYNAGSMAPSSAIGATGDSTRANWNVY